MMCGCWKLCLLLFLLVVGVLYWAFVFNLFLVQQSFEKVESWLLHFNYIVYISVPCPFLKVQWASQESVIVTFPSHVHL